MTGTIKLIFHFCYIMRVFAAEFYDSPGRMLCIDQQRPRHNIHYYTWR